MKKKLLVIVAGVSFVQAVWCAAENDLNKRRNSRRRERRSFPVICIANNTGEDLRLPAKLAVAPFKLNQYAGLLDPQERENIDVQRSTRLMLSKSREEGEIKFWSIEGQLPKFGKVFNVWENDLPPKKVLIEANIELKNKYYNHFVLVNNTSKSHSDDPDYILRRYGIMSLQALATQAVGGKKGLVDQLFQLNKEQGLKKGMKEEDIYKAVESMANQLTSVE